MSFQQVLFLLIAYKYHILFPLAAFEGPVVSLMVGFLVRSGIFDFWPAYLILLLGDIIPDSIFYCIGYFGNRTKVVQDYILHSKFFQNYFPAVEKLWEKHPRKTMFLGKLAYGMALPFLVSAGVAKLPYRKFIFFAVPISLLQYGCLLCIGYLAGSFYVLALRYVELLYFGLSVLVIIFGILYISVRKYSRREIIKQLEENE